MGEEIGRWKKASARRKSRTAAAGPGLHPHPVKEEGKRWGLVIAGTFLLALVAFISGIWVGKAINELQYHPKLPSQNKPEKKKKDALYQPELKKQNDSVKRETKASTAESTDKREEKSRTSPTKPKLGDEKSLPPAEEVVSQSSPGAKSEQAKARFTLQVGAFNNSEEAQQWVNQLKNKGYAAYQITGSAAAKGMLYRVRVGRFPSLQDARQFALIFEKKEKIKTIITTLPGS
jgi:cell division septation protein DedD